MPSFFPRDVVQWGEERVHPLRAFAIRTVEPAGVTGLVLRLWRAVVLGSTNWVLIMGGLVAGVVLLCGVLTWHLGNFPVRKWPARVTAFVIIEAIAELGMSFLLIGFGRERIGSRVAHWGDWWTMAGQTFLERAVVCTLFALVLGAVVQLVRRRYDRRKAQVHGA